MYDVGGRLLPIVDDSVAFGRIRSLVQKFVQVINSFVPFTFTDGQENTSICMNEDSTPKTGHKIDLRRGKIYIYISFSRLKF